MDCAWSQGFSFFFGVDQKNNWLFGTIDMTYNSSQHNNNNKHVCKCIIVIILSSTGECLTGVPAARYLLSRLRIDVKSINRRCVIPILVKHHIWWLSLDNGSKQTNRNIKNNKHTSKITSGSGNTTKQTKPSNNNKNHEQPNNNNNKNQKHETWVSNIRQKIPTQSLRSWKFSVKGTKILLFFNQLWNQQQHTIKKQTAKKTLTDMTCFIDIYKYHDCTVPTVLSTRHWTRQMAWFKPWRSSQWRTTFRRWRRRWPFWRSVTIQTLSSTMVPISEKMNCGYVPVAHSCFLPFAFCWCPLWLRLVIWRQKAFSKWFFFDCLCFEKAYKPNRHLISWHFFSFVRTHTHTHRSC